MKTFKDLIEKIFGNDENLKKEISNECKKMPVIDDNNANKKKKISRYIYPQLMKAKIISYMFAGGSPTKTIKTDLATVIISDNKVEIEWTIKAIILAKKYYNKDGHDQTEGITEQE